MPFCCLFFNLRALTSFLILGLSQYAFSFLPCASAHSKRQGYWTCKVIFTISECSYAFTSHCTHASIPSCFLLHDMAVLYIITRDKISNLLSFVALCFDFCLVLYDILYGFYSKVSKIELRMFHRFNRVCRKNHNDLDRLKGLIRSFKRPSDSVEKLFERNEAWTEF